MSQSNGPQRRYRRVSVQVPVQVATIDPEMDPRTGRAYFRSTRDVCANLSRGGAFIRTTDPLPPGRRVMVEIDVPDGTPIQTIGRVAWSKSVLGPGGTTSEIGVEFLGGSVEALRALEQLGDVPEDRPTSSRRPASSVDVAGDHG